MILISFFVIVSDNRFWMFFSTWQEGTYTRIGIGLLLACIPLTGYILHIDRTKLLARYLAPCAVMLVMVVTCYRFGLAGVSIPTRLLILIAFCHLLLCLSSTRKRQLLATFTIVFAFLMLLGLIYYLLRLIGIDCTAFMLDSPNPIKVELKQNYSISALGVLLNKGYGDGFNYCGYFDEAGCLGTFIALLFVASQEALWNNNRVLLTSEILLLVEGFFTFSFAFYLIVGLYLLIKCAVARRWSYVFAIVAAVVVIAFVMNWQFDNHSLMRLQERFSDFFNGDKTVDNRLSDAANMKMKEFFTADSIGVSLFGYGPSAFGTWQSANVVDGASVYYYLYDRGYLGMFLYFLSFILMFLYASKSGSRSWILLLLFTLSTYQRPEIFTSIYMTILILGANRWQKRDVSRGRQERIRKA